MRQYNELFHCPCCISGAVIAMLILLAAIAAPARADFRPPAVPLVVSDPYFSIWSEGTNLAEHTTVHWTQAPQPLISMIRIDGHVYRIMGAHPISIPTLRQLSVRVLPTRTMYRFAGHGITLILTFTTPRLPGDLDVFSWPLTYLTWRVHATDGHTHQIAIFDSTSSLVAVNKSDEVVQAVSQIAGALRVMRVGTGGQPILGSGGDRVRINWGYCYAAARHGQAQSIIAADKQCNASFIAAGKLPAADDAAMPRPAGDHTPVMAFVFDLGSVGEKPISRTVMLAYDERYAISYFGWQLRPYFRHAGMTAMEMLQEAVKHHAKVELQCQAFDKEIMVDAEAVGGLKYADICALAYRQSLGACGLAADRNGKPLMFTKENTSDGNISTVDVIFPMSPLPLLISPTLTKAMLLPVMDYSQYGVWPQPFAPHDLGASYPFVTGHPDGGGENMFVEETGNMLILTAAMEEEVGNTKFADQYWPTLTKWAHFLKKKGFDPGLQLSTDDFAGPLAHSANLSVKAIEGIAAYGKLCKMRGDAKAAYTYSALARQWALRWMKADRAGDHYKIAFNWPDSSWSELYNMAWDPILGFNAFPPNVEALQTDFYLGHQNPYGLPLDSRHAVRQPYTKTDWTTWIATMAPTRTGFNQIINRVYIFLNTTPTRLPMQDGYYTTNGVGWHNGLFARPVVGGVFIKMLADKKLWTKYVSQAQDIKGPWAVFPKPPRIISVIPTSLKQPYDWQYTTTKPPANWNQPGFDAVGWKTGSAGFGSNNPGVVPRTKWLTDDIWLRRSVTIPNVDLHRLKIYCYHDEDVQIYINGIFAASARGFVSRYTVMPIRSATKNILKTGKRVLIAVHVHQTTGGQFFDLGLVQVDDRFDQKN